MKQISAALKSHYAQGSTTLARCIRLERKDGFILTVNGSARTFVYLGETYQSRYGMRPWAIAQDAAPSVQNSELSGPLDDDTVTDAEILGGLWDGCEITIFEVNYKDLTMGHLMLQTSNTGNLSTSRSAFNAEARSLAQFLQQTVGRVFTANCPHDLGDDKCQVNLVPITVTGALTGVTNRRVVTDSARGEAANRFKNGVLTCTSGANVGVSREVAAFASGVFTLCLPFRYNPVIGDTYQAIPGCQKRHARSIRNPTGISDCIDGFNNIVHFGGFPFVPGNKKTLGLGGTEGSNL